MAYTSTRGDGTPLSPGGPSSRAPPRRLLSNVSLPETKSGIFGASSNLVNSIVGAGIIGIPYAMNQAGLVAGILLLVFVAYLTDKSLRTLVELASFHPNRWEVLTYEDLMSIPFGKPGSYFVMANMFILAYGAMVAYLLIIKDTVPTVLGLVDADEQDFWLKEGTMFLTSLVIVVPLMMMRDMASLELTSTLSVTADIILVGIIVAFAPVQSTVQDSGGVGQVLTENWINSKLFIGLGVFSTAMASQHSAFIVSGSLEDKTAKRWGTVTFRSISISAFLCILLGVIGYLGFLGETQGDILNNFGSGSLAANAGRALLALTMFFTYPMESFVARHVLVQLWYNGDMDGNTEGPDGKVIPEQKLFGFLGRRVRVSALLYITTLLPALYIDDLGPVLSLTGSLGASCIAYIGPGLVYFGINGDDFLSLCAVLLEEAGYKEKTTGANMELPIAGDAQAPLATPMKDPLVGPKPWWWWPMGFPIWVTIARTGARGTRNFLSLLDEDCGEPSPPPGALPLPTSEEIIGPSRKDYYIAMVQITFGTVAMVIGVASNIYVELNDMFYAPV